MSDVTLAPTSDTAVWVGTSLATPHVSGVAALVWSQNPGWTNVQVRQKLQTSVEDLGFLGRDQLYGYGRIDACFAVEAGCQSVYPLLGTIEGPTEVRPDETCSWQMIASGARQPYSSQWWGTVSGTGSYVMGELWESDWIYVTTTSLDNQQITRQVWVEVSEEADECDS